ncbi:MAG: ABC transporter substrate-binding protein [Acetobacteraceae bacterium]
MTKPGPLQPEAGMTRRSFMNAALASGLTIAAASSLWDSTAKAEPKTGGHLRLGLAGGSTADTLDPSPWGDTFMVVVGYAVRGGLTEFGPDGTLKPDAAVSWESSDGAKKWIFKLQKGATFSNGKSLTADDVVASLNFHRGEKSQSGAKALFDGVTTIKADGSNTVVVELSAGAVDFPYSLTDHHLNIMPAKDGEADWRSGIGAGPYILEAFEPGVRAILKRNPNSYRTAYLDSAEMLGVADVVARQAALTSGRVDVINQADLKTVSLLKRRPGIRVEETAGRLHYWLTARTTTEPFTHPDVRTALKYAIDREAILKTVFNGHGRIGNDQPITPAYRYYDASLAPKTYDPDKARFHLKQAGFDTITADFHVSDAAFNGAVDLAVLYQQQAAKAGITIKVVRESADGYWANIRRNAPSWYATYWSGRATEDTMFTVGLSENSPWNYGKWSNPDFNRILVQARQEEDEAKRRELYYRLQQIASEDSGVVIPIFANSVFALTDKVQHPAQIAGNWELDGARVIERWWLA